MRQCLWPRRPADAALLGRLERYHDSVPRTRSRVEEVGPFTLFVAKSGWPYYARPRLGDAAAASPDDVRRVLARQREIGVPQSIEWVDETTPRLLRTVRSVGVEVEVCPLLVLGRGTSRRRLGRHPHVSSTLTCPVTSPTWQSPARRSRSASETLVRRRARPASPSVTLVIHIPPRPACGHRPAGV